MALGCIAEAIGYVGRLMLHENPFDNIGFQIQICTLIIAPSFFSGAIYLTLKHICLALGPHLSLVRPKLYTWLFIGFDLLSLTLQGAGGGIAATAKTKEDQDVGTNIMIAGIIWQVVTLVAFAVLIGHFFWRLLGDGGRRMTIDAQKVWANSRFTLFLISLGVAFFAIFVRCVYRIAEMVGGWRNHIMQDEISFIVLEGVLCLIAAILLTAIHPGTHFPQMRTGYQKRKVRFSMMQPQAHDASYVELHQQPFVEGEGRASYSVTVSGAE
ncbi:hypothetical protein AJ79_08317 [Helicocarpus griseus UAMH5409]|uniref:RTA1 domain-containing protein n=1 Tax=Helicocarpus griseus UAMH5409 TaxID=1447875 RepID=A0A2B7WTB9_9EURO|nr:hypothetical protein AJ79_08317 [Helicocarpus griseus UAMH5409]